MTEISVSHIAGERADRLATAITHMQVDGVTARPGAPSEVHLSSGGSDDDATAALLRALMRIEAQLLVQEAEDVRGDHGEARTSAERRRAAFEHIYSQLRAAGRVDLLPKVMRHRDFA